MTFSLRNWGVRIALVYIAFATATIGFVTFAMSQDVDLVSPDYYARSLAHDDRLDAMARADALGDTFRVSASQDGRSVQLTIPAGASTGLRGAVTLYRPSDASADRSYDLALDAAGRQQIAFTDEAAGAWRLQVRWTAATGDYYAERPLVLR